ncbi:hypothetical protein IWQ52_001272 [Labrenzia sp. EL_159]|nr:hypothetical protein [Labrenzia sp. EL_162]MBG6193770.1 hypothetical protein [Labrenzia sp. EL_159]
MEVGDLSYANLTTALLTQYEKRAATDSARFLRWFLENIYRQDLQDADDACVDKKQDKGVDGILVNDVIETVFIFQSKVRQNEKSTLGDTDLKEFWGTLAQFETEETVQLMLDSAANAELKSAIIRHDVKAKIAAGYNVEGVFCTNVSVNQDAKEFLQTCPEIVAYDANRISAEFIDLDAKSGVDTEFQFDVSDTQIVKHATSQGVQARIFLASALQLLHMQGIADGTLFSQNVRLSLGNTKVNKSLTASIREQSEHTNFPLYHNGITVLCRAITFESDEALRIKGYMVVNGAQSLTSLLNAKAAISQDLRVLVKVVELGDDSALSDKITTNSNNQNAIKARDLKSNNPIQERLKKEVSQLGVGELHYEVKRGELVVAQQVISNEDAGLALLALDLGEPWACHQKYKVMDESHARIFGRSDVNGAKIVALMRALESVKPSLDEFDDKLFGHYTLTRYFLGFVVAEIIKGDQAGKNLFSDFNALIKKEKLDRFATMFARLASTTVDDINAEVQELSEGDGFDCKRDLKSPRWCRTICAKLKASYSKDVKRKKASPIGELVAEL